MFDQHRLAGFECVFEHQAHPMRRHVTDQMHPLTRTTGQQCDAPERRAVDAVAQFVAQLAETARLADMPRRWKWVMHLHWPAPLCYCAVGS